VPAAGDKQAAVLGREDGSAEVDTRDRATRALARAVLGFGDDGKSFKWIAFRSASTELGQALLSSPPDQRWWLAGTIKRDEWNGGNAAEMHLEDAALA
jgi:hypothetical protein